MTDLPPLRLVLDGRVDELDRLTGWLDTVDGGPLPRPGLPFDLKVAAYEAVANVLSYAFTGGGQHTVTVEVSWVGRVLVVVIEDDGTPFDPTAVPDHVPANTLAEAPVSGRGIALMRRLSDQLRYERRDGRNRLTITGHADTPPSPRLPAAERDHAEGVEP